MPKSGVFEGDPPPPAAAEVRSSELKKELKKLVWAIAEEDDVNLAAVDKAQQLLLALKESKLKRAAAVKMRNRRCNWEIDCLAAPEEFKCPLSKELMRDPVIIATGQTFDRPFIQKWLKTGNRTCPKTEQVLSHTILTPNHLIRTIIAQHCKKNGITLPDPNQYTNEYSLTQADQDLFISLLEKMSSSLPLPEQKEAAKQLRLLTKKNPSFRALFSEYHDSIPKLLFPLSRVHPDHIQEDVITTLLNISIHDSNKKLVAETPRVIDILMNALKNSGTIETRSNAAAAIFVLSALDSNKALIGKSGALKPLIDLLDEGHPLAMKDVASAIFNLCVIHENKTRAVSEGVIRVILEKIVGGIIVDELLSILAMLSTNQRAVEEMGELGGVSCLLGIIRESSCARNQENCVAILYTICYNDRSKLKEVKEEENLNRTISRLARNGSSRAKRKANGILERLNRVVNLTHTA
ncbi:U-box domain-containing protein 9 [Striga hermonthica]|uniref:RING-type E3 ubiquitin transferase n=1 Tax=Striga hermonthica TaxID=68872 RepID=A0A9N7RG24_STRHE|nr:U-box domain-containing protein 9 [Striga hermonthica]